MKHLKCLIKIILTPFVGIVWIGLLLMTFCCMIPLMILHVSGCVDFEDVMENMLEALFDSLDKWRDL